MIRTAPPSLPAGMMRKGAGSIRRPCINLQEVTAFSQGRWAGSASMQWYGWPTQIADDLALTVSARQIRPPTAGEALRLWENSPVNSLK